MGETQSFGPLHLTLGELQEQSPDVHANRRHHEPVFDRHLQYLFAAVRNWYRQVPVSAKSNTERVVPQVPRPVVAQVVELARLRQRQVAQLQRYVTINYFVF